MSEELIIELAQMTLQTIALMAAPMILTIAIVGLLSNMLQTVTQIRDQALAFVPKVIATGIVLVISVPWLLHLIQRFTRNIFTLMSNLD